MPPGGGGPDLEDGNHLSRVILAAGADERIVGKAGDGTETGNALPW
jgi:hypothetical protein